MQRIFFAWVLPWPPGEDSIPAALGERVRSFCQSAAASSCPGAAVVFREHRLHQAGGAKQEPQPCVLLLQVGYCGSRLNGNLVLPDLEGEKDEEDLQSTEMRMYCRKMGMHLLNAAGASRSHRMVGLEKTSKPTQFQPKSRNTTPAAQGPSMAVGTGRDGAPIAQEGSARASPPLW